MALTRMRMMLIERLRRSQISDEDFRFIAQTMQSLVYRTKAEMAAAMHLTPRSLHRTFNDRDRTAPQQRITIFERYLRAVEDAIAKRQFNEIGPGRQRGPKLQR